MNDLQERLIRLEEIRDYVEDERKNAIRQRDWKRVKLFECLEKQRVEKVMTVYHMIALTKRHKIAA